MNLSGIKYDVPYNINEPNTNDTGKIKVKKAIKILMDEALAVAEHVIRLRFKRGQRQMDLIKNYLQKHKKQTHLIN